MNAIVISILIMVGLSLSRVPVVAALIVAAVSGGLYSGLSIHEVLDAFNDGIGDGAGIALSYASLGAFAVALARSGITEGVAQRFLRALDGQRTHPKTLKTLLVVSLLTAAICSQNLVPVHIAFIPIVVIPLLPVFNRLKLDRRLVACVITFGITAPYMLLPVGFGAIFLNDILLANINAAGESAGLEITAAQVPMAMALPISGMLVGLLVAIFISYRRPRAYEDRPVANQADAAAPQSSTDKNDARARLRPWQWAALVVSIGATLTVQLWLDSMVLGALAGFVVLSLSGVFRWREQDGVFSEGMRLMATIGFIMITAAGFASVMQATGEIDSLVQSAHAFGSSQALAALIMLLVGLFITMGIGSSFSTIPIIASLYVPLALSFGFSPMATVALVGTAAALGDAGSPASDSTLGPTSGLAADGQHDHIRDSVVPTFIHYNLPLMAFGWIAAMIL